MANIIPVPTQSQIPEPGVGIRPGYNLGAGIDALFQAYQLARQTAVQNAVLPGQVQAQNLANQGALFGQNAAAVDYAATHYGYQPDVLRGSFQPPANPADGGPQSLYSAPSGQTPTTSPAANQSSPVVSVRGQQNAAPVAPMYSGQQMPLGPQVMQQQPQINQPMVGGPFGHKSPQEAAQALMQFVQMGQQMGAQNALAGLSKTQAEAEKAGAEANLTEAQVKMLGGAGSMTDNYVNQIQSGKMSLDDLGSLGRGELANAIKVAVGAKLAASGTNVAAIGNQIKASGAGLTAQADVQKGVGQTVGSAAGTLEDILNQAAPLASKLSPTQFQAVNSAFSKGKQITNDPLANEFLAYMNEARGKYAQVLSLGKGATDTERAMAAESIGRGLTPDAFAGMQKAVNFAAKSTMNRLQGQGYNQPGPAAPSPDATLKSAIDPKAEAIIKTGLSAGHSRAQIKAALKAGGF